MIPRAVTPLAWVPKGRYGHLLTNLLGLIALCLILSPIAVYFGASVKPLAEYIAYVALFDIVPGTLLYCCLNKDWHLTRGVAVVGWTLGLCLETSLFDIMDRLGLRAYLHLYPLVLVPLCLLILANRRDPEKAASHPTASFHPAFVLVAAMALIFIAIDAFGSLINYNFLVQASISNVILQGAPYRLFEGVPLLYNYLIHMHVAAASLYTGVDTVELVSRPVPFLLSLLCLCSIYFTGINLYRNRWIGILVIAQVFGVIGYQYIEVNFFVSAVPAATVTLLSSMAAFPIFFVLVTETFSAGSLAEGEERTIGPGQFLIICMLLWAGSGMRTPAVVGYGAGLGVLIVWNYLRDRRISWNLMLLLAATVGIFAASLVRFYGVLSPYSATKFLVFVSGPAVSFDALGTGLFQIIKSTGLPYYLCGLLAFLVMVSGKATFLDGGLYWLLAKRQMLRHKVDLFWLGAFLCGCFFLCFTWAPGGSNFTFVHYAQFALAFIGARGLCLFLQDPQQSSKSGLVIITLIVGLGLLQFGETGYALMKKASALRYQANEPMALEGQDFAQFVDYLKTRNTSRCAYVLASDMDPDTAYPVIAEMQGMRQFASSIYLGKMLDRSEIPELRNRYNFMKAVLDRSDQMSLDSVAFAALKQKFGITECLTVVFARNQDLGGRSFTGVGWKFEAGRFAVLAL